MAYPEPEETHCRTVTFETPSILAGVLCLLSHLNYDVRHEKDDEHGDRYTVRKLYR